MCQLDNMKGVGDKIPSIVIIDFSGEREKRAEQS